MKVSSRSVGKEILQSFLLPLVKIWSQMVRAGGREVGKGRRREGGGKDGGGGEKRKRGKEQEREGGIVKGMVVARAF